MNKRKLIYAALFCAATLLGILFASCSGNSQGNVRLEGDWQGHVTLGGKEKSMFVHFYILDSLAATIDIPEQGASGIPLSKVVFKYPKISFELESDPNTVKFDGVLDKSKITGSVTQGTATGKLAIERTDSVMAENVKTWKDEPVSIDTKNGKIIGTLVVPASEGPFPAILIVTDMGPTDRDGNSMFSKTRLSTLRQLSESLASQGIASLRYDRRGIGESAIALGKMNNLRLGDYVDDALGFLDLLEKDRRFFSRGVLTHGDGSVVGIRASAAGKADFLIAVASPSRSQGETIIDQYKSVFDGATFEKAKAIVMRLSSGKPAGDVDPVLRRYFPPEMEQFFISWFGVSPISEIAKLKIPVMVISGTADPVATIADRQMLAKANKLAILKVVPGMNHELLVKAKEAAAATDDKSKPQGILSKTIVEDIFLFIAELSVQQGNPESAPN
jgi:uncharacterized protein